MTMLAGDLAVPGSDLLGELMGVLKHYEALKRRLTPDQRQIANAILIDYFDLYDWRHIDTTKVPEQESVQSNL